MKTFKTWTITVFWSIFILVGAIVFINVVVDPYGILRTDFSRQFQAPDLNFCKIKFLLKNTKKFDSFIFGSSRVAVIDVKKIFNGRYYNMTYAEGVPGEHLENIRFLLKNDVSIRNLMIGLDDFSYLIDPQCHCSDLSFQPHPAVAGKKLHIFYAEYFLKLKGFVPQLKAYIRHNYTERKSPEEMPLLFDVRETGQIAFPAWDGDFERDPETYVLDKRFSKPTHYEGDNIANTLVAMKEIIVLAKKNDINLIVFINPVHKTTYLDTNLKQFAFFKKELAAITDYYDFSGLNSITTNNYYYYETSHYRPLVADMMLKIMLGAPNVVVPRDFGFHATRTNIDAHLKNQCREIRKIRSKLNDINAAFAGSCEKITN